MEEVGILELIQEMKLINMIAIIQEQEIRKLMNYFYMDFQVLHIVPAHKREGNSPDQPG